MLRAKHAYYFDGIRGFAALIVVFGHCSNAGIHIVPGINLHSSAKAGVWLFFVLSAFLLTKSLASDIADKPLTKVLGRYAARRVFRIMPVYTVVLCALFLSGLMSESSWVRHILLFEGAWHLWTIPVEMKFYFWLPLIALAATAAPVSLKWPSIIFLIALSSVAYWIADPKQIAFNSTNLLNYLPFFSVGVVIALAAPRLKSSVAVLLGIAALVILPIASPRMIAWINGETISDALEWSWLYAVVWGGLMVAVLNARALQAIFSRGPLVLVGKLSYGLYLTHFHIISLVQANTYLPAPIKGSVAFAISMMVSFVLFKLVEKPGLAFGTRLFSDKAYPHGYDTQR